MDAHSERYDLFPQIKASEHGMLALDPRHEMYWEQSGNPDGEPVVFLHGGPGAGAGMVHRRFFDPRHYRIIIFDQRGAGRSRPFAELRDNTTGHLIEDIDTLRRHLGVERWLVFGGSWGATLALAYGIARPERCTGFVLRGVFLCRKRERGWFLYGMRTVFPEAWREFAGFLPEDDRAQARAADMVDAVGRHARGQAGTDGGLTRRVLALPGGQHLAHDDLGGLVRGDAGAFHRCGNDDGAELRCRDRAQGAVERPDRRAGGAGNHDIGHWSAPFG